MRCALASATLSLVKDAKEYLTESRRRLGLDGKFPTEEVHRDFIAKVLAWKVLFSEELLKQVLGRPSITSALSLIGMARGMERLEHLWDLAVEKAKTTLKDPYCEKALKPGKP